jgi:hypothetical protein
VNHTYTEPGEYDVHLTATGFSGLTAEDHFQLHITGHMPTTVELKITNATNPRDESPCNRPECPSKNRK